MCDLNGPFKLCSCAGEIDESKPHWALKTKALRGGSKMHIVGTLRGEVNVVEIIKEQKIIHRLNSKNLFDFDYTPKEKDELCLHESEDNYVKLLFKKGKWTTTERLGSHEENQFKKIISGKIEGPESDLTKTYKKYLSTLKNREDDITICHIWGGNEISESDLVDLLNASINGEPIVFPEGYSPVIDS